MADLKMPAGVHKLTRVPKGNDVKGKVWADARILLPDGTAVTGRYETTRGAFVYFIAQDQHYRAFTERFGDIDSDSDIAVFNLRGKDV